MIERITALESQLSKVESSLKAAQRRGRNAWIASGVILFSTVMLAAIPQVQAQFGVTLASLNTRLTAVENKTAPLFYNSTTKLLTVSGANVMINDGSGATESTSGLGNLQVGYNEMRGTGDVRTGTHNLILGSRNNYSSFGGFVVGDGNSISAKYAVVSGGRDNSASGDWSSVSGGATNASSGAQSSVSGGGSNMATGLYASVSGGYGNAAGDQFTSVSGGFGNLASGVYSSVSGGNTNTASGTTASVSGGIQNNASGQLASVSGGILNTASGDRSSVLGGSGINLNTANGTYPAGP